MSDFDDFEIRTGGQFKFVGSGLKEGGGLGCELNKFSDFSGVEVAIKAGFSTKTGGLTLNCLCYIIFYNSCWEVLLVGRVLRRVLVLTF